MSLLVKLNLSIKNGISSFRIQDKLEDTKWVIKGRNAKHIQYNGIQKRGQKPYNGRRNVRLNLQMFHLIK